MTDQPDTAAIRAFLDGPRRYPCAESDIARDLCDALDAARADLIHVHETADIYLARAEAAEACIAKAMSICAEYAYADAPVPIALLERALTGGTE